MTCRHCAQPIALTRYGWGHTVVRHGGDKHPAVPAPRQAPEHRLATTLDQATAQELAEAPGADVGRPTSLAPESGAELEIRQTAVEDLVSGRPDSSEEGAETAGASPRLCAGCDQPLPAGSRPNRRTHNDACRQRAAYRRATNSARTDADGASPILTVSRQPDGAPAPRPAPAEPAPISGAPQRQPDQERTEAPIPAGGASTPPAVPKLAEPTSATRAGTVPGISTAAYPNRVRGVERPSRLGVAAQLAPPAPAP